MGSKARTKELIILTITRGGLFEMGIKDGIQTPGLIYVAIDTILNFLGSIFGEVIGLTLHRTNPGVEEEELAIMLVCFALKP